MIRQLTKKDHKMLMTFVMPEAAFNLFIIGNVEQFGYNTSYQNLWSV